MATQIEDRTAELLKGTGSMTKADLLAHCKQLAALAASAEGGASVPAGLIVTALYVGGAEHRGTLVELHRCTPRGETGDQWCVRHGGKMFTKEGHPMKYTRWSKLTPALKARTSMPFDVALRFARSKV